MLPQAFTHQQPAACGVIPLGHDRNDPTGGKTQISPTPPDRPPWWPFSRGPWQADPGLYRQGFERHTFIEVMADQALPTDRCQSGFPRSSC